MKQPQSVITLREKCLNNISNKSFLLQRSDAVAILKYIEELEKRGKK